MPHCRVDICPCGPSGVLPKAEKGQKTAIFGRFRAFRAPEKIINLRNSSALLSHTRFGSLCKKLERLGSRSGLIILKAAVNLSKCFSTKNRQNCHALTQQQKVAKRNDHKSTPSTTRDQRKAFRTTSPLTGPHPKANLGPSAKDKILKI